VIDETEPQVESDLRRRAAWLLGMLVVVAVLFVIVMTVLIDSGGSKDKGQPRLLDGAATTAATTRAPSSHPASRTRSTTASTSSAATSTARHGPASCPTPQPCALDDDIGDAVAAVNAYRTQHGQPALPGAVSAAAKECAVTNGSGCSGSWAETLVSGPDGEKAVNKIARLAKLLSPMKSFGVGWAYDPTSKQYFFAVVRND
jgi:hypothetical protein